MGKEKEKLGVFPYVVGGISYIPLIGVPIGIITIIYGLITRKRGGKILALIGAGGIASTLLIYSGLFYFGFVQRGGIFDELKIELAETTLTSLVRDIEFYKTQNGAYPTSLKTLLTSFPDAYVFDPTQVKLDTTQEHFFYYHPVSHDHYYLLGVGADGEAFTSDDIYPNVEVEPDSDVGLLIRNR